MIAPDASIRLYMMRLPKLNLAGLLSLISINLLFYHLNDPFKGSDLSPSIRYNLQLVMSVGFS
ncbi:hypothetical protein HA38_04240 [Pantoea allii]|nr:hypothetical protein HA38_04240 [Pantoea allii]